MRLKLLIVFIISFSVIFGFRAYGDYTTGGFPTYGYANFLYWTLLYSSIPLVPAFFIFQIASPSLQQSKQSSKSLLPALGKVIVTILAIIISAWVGGYIGLLFTANRQGLDALSGAGIGAPIGAAIGLLLCWFFFYKRNKLT